MSIARAWDKSVAGIKATPCELTIERRPVHDLDGIGAQWRELAAQALEPNIFYEAAFASEAAKPFGADVEVALVWGPNRRLVGLFPFRLTRRRYGVPMPILIGWTHPFAPLGTPLIDRDAPAAIITAFLDYVAGDKSLPRFVLWPLQNEGGLFALALRSALAGRRCRSATFGVHQRAAFIPPSCDVDHAMRRKKRKEFERQRRRLDEQGATAFTSVRDDVEIDEATTRFLSLEENGWKGRAGSAASQNKAVAAFLRDAMRALASEDKACAHYLTSAGRDIAAGLTLQSQNRTWFWKIAYDEAFAPYSPGVQLTIDLTRKLLAQNIELVDSCADPDHPMIDQLWRERLTIADHFIAVEPGQSALFNVVCRLESLRRAAERVGKQVRRQLRGR